MIVSVIKIMIYTKMCEHDIDGYNTPPLVVGLVEEERKMKRNDNPGMGGIGIVYV